MVAVVSVTFTRPTLLLLSVSLFAMALYAASAAPTYKDGFCSNSTIKPNGKYQTNLNTVLQSLHSNANTTNLAGFSTTTAASGNDTTFAMYGLFLCRGDQNTTSCSNCVSAATQTDLPRSCPNSVWAVLWYDECMVRYSNKPISGMMDVLPRTSLWSIRNLTTSQAGFSEIFVNTIDNVVVQAAKDDVSGTNKKYFATSEAKIRNSRSSQGGTTTLYVLAQCTPDLTAFDCNRCLTTAVGRLMVSDSGRVLQPSCNVRYSTHPFFTSLSAGPTSAPTPEPIPAASDSPQPGRSASGKMTIPHLSVLVVFGNLVIVNLYNHII